VAAHACNPICLGGDYSSRPAWGCVCVCVRACVSVYVCMPCAKGPEFNTPPPQQTITTTKTCVTLCKYFSKLSDFHKLKTYNFTLIDTGISLLNLCVSHCGGLLLATELFLSCRNYGIFLQLPLRIRMY
jgi:hypothetical protein